MEPKLVRRAANKYHAWLTKQRRSQQMIKPENIEQSLRSLEDKASEVSRLTRMFAACTSGRKQVCHWDGHVVHEGIPSPETHRSLASRVIPNLCESVIKDAQHILSEAKRTTNTTNFPEQSLRDVVREIEIVTNAWSETDYRNGTLSVAVEGVCLSHYDDLLDQEVEVELGTFWIHLDLNCPTLGLEIEEDGEHYSSSELSHPHVSGGRLCTGDGDLAMADAICQGRLEDYFRIVEAILRTYNHSSPYGGGLRDWYADEYSLTYCHTCEDYTHESNVRQCSKCEESFCPECSKGSECTECNNWVCESCSTGCNDCGHTVCDDCIVCCEACGQPTCNNCSVRCNECDLHFCDSCVSVCQECGESICHSCSTSCESCHDNHCPGCITIECDKCGHSVCDRCVSDCAECGKQICNNCLSGTCGGCGSSHCNNCHENHACLLVGVDDG